MNNDAKCCQTVNNRIQTLLYLLRICLLPRVLFTYIVPIVGGEIFTFAPSLSLIYSAHAVHLIFHTDKQLFTKHWTVFYPVTGLPLNITAVTRTAYYPVSLIPVHNFLCTYTMLMYLYRAQICECLIYSISRFFQANFCCVFHLNLAGLSSYILGLFRLFLWYNKRVQYLVGISRCCKNLRELSSWQPY